MLTTTHRRLLVPLFGIGASALVLAGCSSDSDGGSPFSSSAASSQVQSQAVSSATASAPSAVTSAPSSESSDSSDSGGSRSIAAFCDAYDLNVVKNAGTDPQAAIVVLRKVKDVAPDAIRADAEYIYNALNDAASGKIPDDVSKITDASANVARYYGENCS